MLCATDVTKEQHKANLDKLWYRWIDPKSNTFRIHGDSDVAYKTFVEWGEYILEKPIHHAVKLTNPEIKRLNIALDKYNKRISGQFINRVEDLYFVPEAISGKDPIARVFYEKLNQAQDYERVGLGMANNLQKIIQKYMRDA